MKTVVINPCADARLSEIARRYGFAELSGCDAGCWELAILRENDELELIERSGGGTARHRLDVARFVRAQRSYPASKRGVFNQALGRRTRTVIDATAGWAGDSLLMCAQGLKVIMLEREPVMAALLQDAMQRLAATDWARDNEVSVPELVYSDAAEYLSRRPVNADCVYLDPMFPPKRKTSAAVNKRIRLLQRLVGGVDDSRRLFDAARRCGASRVVVKRAPDAAPLGGPPHESFTGKLVRYDVYFPGGAT